MTSAQQNEHFLEEKEDLVAVFFHSNISSDVAFSWTGNEASTKCFRIGILTTVITGEPLQLC